MRKFLFCVFFVCLFQIDIAGNIQAAAIEEEASVPVVASPVSAPAPVDAVSAASDQFFASGSLSFRDRRKLGLTIPKIAGALKELQKDGELEPDMDKSVVAAMVFERLAAEDMQAYSDAALDIDSILAWIEKLLPLIMMILGLFS